MKQLFTILLFFCFAIAHSQISVSELSAEELEQLRSTKTYFFFRESDDLPALRKAIEDVWTITPIVFVPYDDFSIIDRSNASFFSIGGQFRSYGNMVNIYVYLNLYLPVENKRGKVKMKELVRIDLFPSFLDLSKLKFSDDGEDREFLYTEADLRNWNPGFLRNYLRLVNTYLSEGTELGLYDEVTDEAEIRNLMHSTLYIPDYALLDKPRMWSRSEKRVQDEEDLLKKYPFKYKILDPEALSDLILSAEEDLYYLVYIRSSAEKYVSVYNARTGKMIYNRYQHTTYHLKSKDFRQLAKAVD